ncbi:hypothetical protein [Selenomonas montiformis]|nr:hypothetical protein [Selenomonas montiformis]
MDKESGRQEHAAGLIDRKTGRLAVHGYDRKKQHGSEESAEPA